MILVDSNIPMYLVGGDHPNKARAAQLVEASILAGEALVTDAEVLQEVLHRYAAIGRRDAIGPALEAILGIVDEVFAIDRDAVGAAHRLMLEHPGLGARDAIHLAIMKQQGIRRIMTFDADFDLPGVERLGA